MIRRGSLLIVVPITSETEQVLPRAEMPRLRENVNDTLLDLLYNDPLQVLGDVPVIELTGPLNRWLEAVLAALRGHSQRQPGSEAERQTRRSTEPHRPPPSWNG